MGALSVPRQAGFRGLVWPAGLGLEGQSLGVSHTVQGCLCIPQTWRRGRKAAPSLRKGRPRPEAEAEGV